MTNHGRHIGLLIVIAGLVLAVTSCEHHDPRFTTSAVEDRAAIPVLEAHQVTTLISDSGVTRYRISAPQWLVYDKSTPPFWDFPKGILLEQFDQKLKVEASLRADFAYYDTDAQVWRLRGHVRAKNKAGDRFMTEELYWEQPTERIYSDSAIAIQQQKTIIRGIGFDANQNMTQYTIRQTNGVIPIKD